MRLLDPHDVRMRGAIAGFASVLAVTVAWAGFVLVAAWVRRDLDRTFPDCDPCGFVGYAGRIVIIGLFFLGTFGVIGAVTGWMIEKVVRRIRGKRVTTALLPGWCASSPNDAPDRPETHARKTTSQR